MTYWPWHLFNSLAEVLSELLRSQESAYNIRDGVRQHHLQRAKICSKLIKYPHIEDYTVRVSRVL
jgi:proteasome activator subunit 3 (PA28 gamma)